MDHLRCTGISIELLTRPDKSATIKSAIANKLDCVTITVSITMSHTVSKRTLVEYCWGIDTVTETTPHLPIVTIGCYRLGRACGS